MDKAKGGRDKTGDKHLGSVCRGSRGVHRQRGSPKPGAVSKKKQQKS